ncbi:MAG: hypothetical protein AB7P02_16850 [Alphaproteobacteria bacterium]
MNTANLQMEGMLLALAAICRALRTRGSLSAEEMCKALAAAESGVPGRPHGMSDANAEAILFPIRFLQRAVAQPEEELDYAIFAAHIGRLRDAGASP